jgi:hypothetical protein
MNQSNFHANNDLEDQLSDFKLAEPSATFVENGQAVLARANTSVSKSSWRAYFSYGFSISAVLILTVGFTYPLIRNETRAQDDGAGVVNSLLGSRQIAEHQFLVSSIDREAALNVAATTRGVIQGATPNNLFVENCQECHSAQILDLFIPENFEGSSKELDSLMIRAIEDVMDQS